MWTPPTHIHLPKMMLAGSLAGTQAGGLTHGGHTSRCPDAWRVHKQVASRVAGIGHTGRCPHAAAVAAAISPSQSCSSQ